jgi:hypothetical protein
LGREIIGIREATTVNLKVFQHRAGREIQEALVEYAVDVLEL